MRSSPIEFESKTEARRYLRQKRAEIAEADKTSLDTRICDCLCREIKADTVLVFCPVGTEPNILPFAERLLERGARIAFPISRTDTLELDFRYVSTLADLSVGAYGIREPKERCEKVTDLSGAVCIVPALGFDARGMRIGYGKGYYDRFLAKAGVCAVGVTYSELILQRLTTDKNDIAVDTIITERGVILPNAR